MSIVDKVLILYPAKGKHAMKNLVDQIQMRCMDDSSEKIQVKQTFETLILFLLSPAGNQSHYRKRQVVQRRTWTPSAANALLVEKEFQLRPKVSRKIWDNPIRVFK